MGISMQTRQSTMLLAGRGSRDLCAHCSSQSSTVSMFSIHLVSIYACTVVANRPVRFTWGIDLGLRRLLILTTDITRADRTSLEQPQ